MTLAGTPTVPLPSLGTALLARTSIQCLSSASHHCWLPALTLPGVGSCPYAQRTWLTLLELGLPFEARTVDLSSKPKEFVDAYHEVYPDASGKWCSGIGAYVIPATMLAYRHELIQTCKLSHISVWSDCAKVCRVHCGQELRSVSCLLTTAWLTCLAPVIPLKLQEVDTFCAWAQRPPRCPSS